MNLRNVSNRAKKGEGSLRRNDRGGFEYRVKYTDTNGRKRTKSFTADTVDECLDLSEEFQERIAKLARGADLSDTIADIVRPKLDSDFNKNFTGEQGYSRNLMTLKVLEKSNIGNIPIADITEHQLDYFLRDITSYSNTVISKIYAMLSYAYKVAYRAKLIDYNPLEDPAFRKPKSSQKPKKVRGFTEEEQQLFLEALDNHVPPYGRNTYKLQLLIELYGGLRMGEINALKPEDIDFDMRVIRVTSTVTRGINDRVYIKDGAKTAEGERHVPINNRLEKILRIALDEMRPNPEGLIFYDFSKNDIIHTNQVNCFFQRICEKANLKGFSQHCLRHTFATRCIEAEIPPVVLKKWMGHTDIHVTLDTYADVFAKMDNKAIDKLDTFMDNF